jgi:hypothetical protein
MYKLPDSSQQREHALAQPAVYGLLMVNAVVWGRLGVLSGRLCGFNFSGRWERSWGV